MSSDDDYTLIQRLILDEEYRKGFLRSLRLESRRRTEHTLGVFAKCLGDSDSGGNVEKELASLVSRFMKWSYHTDHSLQYFVEPRLLGQFLEFLDQTGSPISVELLASLAKGRFEFGRGVKHVAVSWTPADDGGLVVKLVRRKGSQSFGPEVPEVASER